MAYIPTEWETGDVITAEKLNKAEEGIAAASPLVITVSMAEGSQTAKVMDKTYAEIEAAIIADAPIIISQKYMEDDALLGAYLYAMVSAGTGQPSGYELTVLTVQGGHVAVNVFKASTKADYPAYDPAG